MTRAGAAERPPVAMAPAVRWSCQNTAWRLTTTSREKSGVSSSRGSSTSSLAGVAGGMAVSSLVLASAARACRRAKVASMSMAEGSIVATPVRGPGIDNRLVVRTFVSWIEDRNVAAEEARALFELQLELHQLALGLRPNISSDEMVELRALMEAGDLEGVLARARSLQSAPKRGR